MKKSAVVIASLMVLSMFSVLGISAEVDGVYDIWTKDNGPAVFVSWYNHDNSVLKGPEYLEKVAQLMADGYTYRGYAVAEYTGGSGKTHGSYEEDYFVKTQLDVAFEGELGLFFRTTPEGLEYYDEGIGSWIDVPETMEVPVEVEELLLQEQFGHEQYVWTRTGRWPWQGYWSWQDSGSDINEPFLTVINEDGTEAVWHIMDIYGTSVAMVVITGEEEWDTRTIFYELPQAGAGAPQLQPKNYGNILNKPYSIYGLDEGQAVPKVFEQYAKYDGDKILTYENSPLDIWFDRYVYQPNHKKAQQERLEQTNWYQKEHGIVVDN